MIIHAKVIEAGGSSPPDTVEVIVLTPCAGGADIYKPVSSSEANYNANIITAWNDNGKTGTIKLSDGNCYNLPSTSQVVLRSSITISTLTMVDAVADWFNNCASCNGINPPAQITFRNWFNYSGSTQAGPFTSTVIEVPYSAVQSALDPDFEIYEVTLNGTNARGLSITDTFQVKEPKTAKFSNARTASISLSSGSLTGYSPDYAGRTLDWVPFNDANIINTTDANVNHEYRNDGGDTSYFGVLHLEKFRTQLDALTGALPFFYTPANWNTSPTEYVPHYGHFTGGVSTRYRRRHADWIVPGVKDNWYTSDGFEWTFGQIPWAVRIYFPKNDITIYGTFPGKDPLQTTNDGDVEGTPV